MNISRKLSDFACPNKECTNHAKRGHGNIVLCDTYGKVRRRLLKCKTCNFRFSERKSSFFFGLHTSEATIKDVIHHLLEGMSFRETALASGLDKDTVQRIWKRFVMYYEESVEALLEEFNIGIEDLIMLLYNRKQKGKHEWVK
jgi:transposase-like protein